VDGFDQDKADPALVAEIKAKLVRNGDTYPLFNTVRFTPRPGRASSERGSLPLRDTPPERGP
jgi:hypothetical protein